MSVKQHDLDTSPRMLGWNHSWQSCQNALLHGKMLHFLAETTNRCNFDCEYCYTAFEAVSDSEDFHAKPLRGELVLSERLALIDAAADLGAKTYDIVGAGEPLIDPLCLLQIKHAVERGLQPVIFTNGSLLGLPGRGRLIAEQLWKLGVTVVVKYHGSAEVHDRIVRFKGAAERRDRALELLIELGFNKSTPTRLGLDNIIYEATLSGIPECLRWCRANNVYLVCSSFIPSGRTQKATEQAASREELRQVFEQCRQIDAEEFGILHSGAMPFIGSGCTCTQFLGLYVTICGEAYGCVGKSEVYGDIHNRSLAEMWQERLLFLRSCFDGGCPPRCLFYRDNEIEKTFRKGDKNATNNR